MYTTGVASRKHTVSHPELQSSEIQRVKQQRVAERLQQARGKAPSGNQDPAQGQGQPLKLNSDAEMRNKLEQNIQELSQMLGIQPVVLASAIAGVVKPQIPVESSQSIASEAKASGDILSAFAEGMESGVTTPPQGTPTSDGGSVMSSIASVVQAVGFDDQGVGLD